MQQRVPMSWYLVGLDQHALDRALAEDWTHEVRAENVPKCEKHLVAIGQSINYVTINLGRKEFPSSCMLHKMMSDAIVQPEKQWS